MGGNDCMNEIDSKVPDNHHQNHIFPETTKARELIKVILVIAICLIVYIPAIRGGFVFDDESMLTNNPVLKDNGLYQTWFTTSQSNYWPITWTSYWVEHKLWGLRPAGYHITNVIIHTVCALVIWRILVHLGISGAFAAAVIFAVHPVNVESTAWIAQRKTVLAMMFFALSLLCYLKYDEDGRRRFYLSAVVLFAAAMLSKGSAAGAPIAILLCIWWRQGTIGKRDILRSMPFFVISAVMSVTEVWFQCNRTIMGETIRSEGFGGRIAVAGAAVWFYIYKALLPIKLIVIYPRWNIEQSQWLWYLPCAALGGIFWVSRRYRKKWGRCLLFALTYYVVMLAPVLGLFDIYFMRFSFVADHYQYLSIGGLISLVVSVGYYYAARFGRMGTVTVKLVLCVTAVILGLLSRQQCHIYRDGKALWSDTLSKDPNSWMARYSLGYIFQCEGDIDKAISYYREATEVKPDCIDAYIDLGVAYGHIGRYAEAIESFRKVIEIEPNYAMAYYNLGITYGRIEDRPAAIKVLEHAVKLRPDYVDAYYSLGCIYEATGRLAEAIGAYKQAVSIKPSFNDVYNKLGMAYDKLGRYNEAIKAYKEAVRISPKLVEAHFNLGAAYLVVGDSNSALEEYKTLKTLDAERANTLFNLIHK